MRRYAVVDESGKVVTEWDKAIDAAGSRVFGEPMPGAWRVIDREAVEQ